MDAERVVSLTEESDREPQVPCCSGTRRESDRLRTVDRPGIISRTTTFAHRDQIQNQFDIRYLVRRDAICRQLSRQDSYD
jgi:hypothetical protein